MVENKIGSRRATVAKACFILALLFLCGMFYGIFAGALELDVLEQYCVSEGYTGYDLSSDRCYLRYESQDQVGFNYVYSGTIESSSQEGEMISVTSIICAAFFFILGIMVSVTDYLKKGDKI